MRHLELSSPAKINLFLDLLGKRSDGYHNITTVFEKIDLCDRIQFTPSADGITVSSNLKELPSNEDNLAYRACSLLKKTYNISRGVKIYIEKMIPISAGLGGGSSNAAITLKGLNRLWKLNLTDEELFDMGKKIGADVPFFIFNHSFAVGTGRGDNINPIKSGLGMWHVIISPPARVLTKEIYEKIKFPEILQPTASGSRGNCSYVKSGQFPLTEKRRDVKMIVRAIEQNDFGGIKRHLYNALEPLAIKKVADISRVKNFVEKMGFDAVKVTGSGPTIFVLIHERKEAEKLRDDFLNLFVSDGHRNEWKIFVARTLKQPRKE